MADKSEKPMTWIGELLRGDGSNNGTRWVTQGGTSITSGPTLDEEVPNGRYVSVTRPDGGKRTAVFNSEGKQVKAPSEDW